jgi:hypothetical protein
MEVEGAGVVFLLVVGIGVVVFVLWVVAFHGGYAGVEEFPDSVEHVHLRRVAEGRVAALCPGAIRLSEMEKVGRADTARAREFWRRFAAASASVERDPVVALRELRGLEVVLGDALGGAERGTGVASGSPGREEG